MTRLLILVSLTAAAAGALFAGGSRTGEDTVAPPPPAPTILAGDAVLSSTGTVSSAALGTDQTPTARLAELITDGHSQAEAVLTVQLEVYERRCAPYADDPATDAELCNALRVQMRSAATSDREIAEALVLLAALTGSQIRMPAPQATQLPGGILLEVAAATDAAG